MEILDRLNMLIRKSKSSIQSLGTVARPTHFARCRASVLLAAGGANYTTKENQMEGLASACPGQSFTVTSDIRRPGRSPYRKSPPAQCVGRAALLATGQSFTVTSDIRRPGRSPSKKPESGKIPLLPSSHLLSPISHLRHAAFTLVELLAVISIIGILLVVGVMGMRGSGGAAKVTGAADQVKVFIDGARQYAKTYNTVVVVGIVSPNVTGGATNDMLKVMAAFYPQLGVNGETTNWVAIGNTYSLPDGVYFDVTNRSSIVTTATATNFFDVATNAVFAPSNSIAYSGGGRRMDTGIAFSPDGALTNAGSFDGYENKIFIPLIPGKRVVGGTLQVADSQTNLAAVIEISGQTGQTIIKRVQ